MASTKAGLPPSWVDSYFLRWIDLRSCQEDQPNDERCLMLRVLSQVAVTVVFATASCTLRWPLRRPPWRLPGAARVRRRRLPGPCRPADGPCACKGHRSGQEILAVYLGSACRTSGAIVRLMRGEVQGLLGPAFAGGWRRVWGIEVDRDGPRSEPRP